jgi:mono/diheme cytochrome c family protein
MRVRVRHFAAAIAGVLALGAMTTGHAVAQDDELPNAPGKETVLEVCTQCHAITMVTAQNRTPEEWDDILQRMVGMGAPANPDQQKTILAYLQKNLAKPGTPAASASAAPAPNALSRP